MKRLLRYVKPASIIKKRSIKFFLLIGINKSIAYACKPLFPSRFEIYTYALNLVNFLILRLLLVTVVSSRASQQWRFEGR